MITVLVSAVLVLVNGFFVAAEFATIAARGSKLEALRDAGHRRAALALESTRQLSLQLAGAQLGVTMASLMLGFVAEPALDHQLQRLVGLTSIPVGVTHALALAGSLALVALVHTVFGETVPKNLAISAPERTLLGVVVPYRLFVSAFRPAVRALNWLAASCARLVGIESRDVLERPRSADEIAAMLDASHEEGLIEEFQHELLTGVLDLAERPVASVMVPWGQVTSVSQDDSVAALEAVVVRTGHSRLPVRGREVRTPRAAPSGEGAVRGVRARDLGGATAATRIVGFVHAKDLLGVPAAARDRPLAPGRIRQLIAIGPDASLEELLVRMRRLRTHLAVVRQPGGEPLGLVTLEDLLEELVGEMRDESDRRPPPRGR